MSINPCYHKNPRPLSKQQGFASGQRTGVSGPSTTRFYFVATGRTSLNPQLSSLTTGIRSPEAGSLPEGPLESPAPSLRGNTPPSPHSRDSAGLPLEVSEEPCPPLPLLACAHQSCCPWASKCFPSFFPHPPNYPLTSSRAFALSVTAFADPLERVLYLFAISVNFFLRRFRFRGFNFSLLFYGSPRFAQFSSSFSKLLGVDWQVPGVLWVPG